MSNEIVTTRDTQLEKQRLGKMALSLTEFGTTSEPKIAAGSVVEIGGSLFVVTVDEAITGWAGIANDTNCYIKLVPDVADFAAEFTTDVPTWSASKQGWYDGIDRYIGGLRRGASAAVYGNKWIYQRSQDNNASHRFYGNGTVEFDDGIVGDVTGDLDGGIVEEGPNAEILHCKVFELGSWNMDGASCATAIVHGITNGQDKIRSATAVVYLTSLGATFDLSTRGGGEIQISATHLFPCRTVGGFFDDVPFNGTGFNRGWITIWYAE